MQGHLNQIIQIFLFFVDKKPNSVRSERNILRPIRVTHCLPSLQWTEAVAGTTTQVWVQRGKSWSDLLQWRWAWVHFEHQKRSSFHDPSQFHQAWVFITSPWTKTVQELGGKLKKFPTSLMCYKMDESNKLCFGRLWVVSIMTSIPQIFVFRFPHLKPFMRRQEKHFEIVKYASWKFAPLRNPPCFPYPKANCITIKPPTYFYPLKESLQVFIYIITFLSRMLH